MSIRRKVVIEASEDTLESCAGLFHIKAVGLWESGGDKELAAFLEGAASAVLTIYKNEYIKDADTFLSHVLAHYTLEVSSEN